MILSGERVFLRAWTHGDAGVLFDLASDTEVATRAGFPCHESIDVSRRVVEEVFSAPECYAVVLRESMSVIGCVQVFVRGGGSVHDADELEIGFWGVITGGVDLCQRPFRHWLTTVLIPTPSNARGLLEGSRQSILRQNAFSRNAASRRLVMVRCLNV